VTALTSDQQLVLPDYPEPADGPLDFYQFATGGLESRLVKRYASAVDRTARNPSPQVNELSVRADAPGVYEFFNGTAWGAFNSLVKGILITNTGNPIAVSSGTTELDLAKYAMTGLTLTTGRYYLLQYNVTYTKSVASDLFDLKVRANSALSGTQIAVSGFNPTRSGSGADETFDFIFKGDATYTSLFFSVIRTGGTGTFSYFGAQVGVPTQYRAWATLSDLGDSTKWSDIA
jgi:hypothetical protein